MARNAGNFVENQFVQGLITEATGLNFPEKAVIESWNTRYKKTGEATRRLGYDAEGGVYNTAGTFNVGVRKSFIWSNPGKEDYRFLVVQSGKVISFFSYDASGDFSAGKKSFSIDLTSYSLPGISNKDVRENTAGFACAEGRLFITHRYCDPLYVEYDPDADTIAVTQYEILIRDTEGIDDGEPEDGTRKTTLSNLHKYNLWNQGWWEKSIGVGDVGYVFPIDGFHTVLGTYPNNAELWWYYRDSTLKGVEYFNPTLTNILDVGNGQAPKGHYIYNAFNIDREGTTGISGVPNSILDTRPNCAGFYASRIWYAGVDDRIYYSQIIENEGTYGKCYQRNDPTAENLSDLLETDGGVVKILGLGKATGLFSAGNALYIFSNSGIWAISGSGAEGTGFAATDFAVRRISTVNMVSDHSLVDVEGTPIWWNLEGIWTIQIAQTGPQVVSLSNDTIKTFLEDEVPVQNRSYVQGAYNSSERTVQWIFKSVETTNITDSFKYDRILEFNVTTGAFYPFKWNINNGYFSTIFSISGISAENLVAETVTKADGITAVTDSALANVTTYESTGTSFRSTQYKYLFIDTSLFTFFEEVDEDYLDFTTPLGTGVDFSSYFVSGAKVHGEGKTGTIEYVTVFANVMPQASAKLQVRWDWTNSGSSGKWSSAQEIYSVNRNYRDVSRKRLLVRGQGPALQINISSNTGKPFTIIGWSSFETVDAVP